MDGVILPEPEYQLKAQEEPAGRRAEARAGQISPSGSRRVGAAACRGQAAQAGGPTLMPQFVSIPLSSLSESARRRVQRRAVERTAQERLAPRSTAAAAAVRVVSWDGQWICACGFTHTMYADCGKCSAAVCRKYLWGECTFPGCRFLHPILDLPARKPPARWSACMRHPGCLARSRTRLVAGRRRRAAGSSTRRRARGRW